MRIMIVTPRFFPDSGGVENVVFNQSRILCSLGHEVTIVTTVSEKSRVGSEEMEGFVVHRCRAISPGNAYFFSPKLGGLVGRLAENFDLIHAHNYHSFPAMHAFRNKKETPFVISCHYHRYSHVGFRNLLHIPYRVFSKKMVECSDLVMCVSNSEKELLRLDFSPKNVIVNHNGVDNDGFVRKEEVSEPVSCAIGRLDRYKNVDLAIRAVSLIPDFRLDIVGKGPDEARLRKIANQLHLNDRVKFHGYVDVGRKNEILSRSASIISLSDHESFGMTLVEGAMQGIPVIASNIPPHREIAEIIGNGISIVGSRDIDEVARKISQTYEKRNELHFSNLERFTWEANVKRLVESYEKVLDR